MTHDKVKNLLDMLNYVRENLYSIPEEIFLSLDPSDNEALDQGIPNIKKINTYIQQFAEISDSISDFIKNYYSISPEEDNLVKENESEESKTRIIKELDKDIPHTLDEDFRYKRPYALVFNKTVYKGLKTWRSLYFNLLNELKYADYNKFMSLPDNDRFKSKRGNKYFSMNKDELRVPQKADFDFYIETNISANTIKNYIKELLEYFEFDKSHVIIYLREDRDASYNL
jgi:hypothetical protein